MANNKDFMEFVAQLAREIDAKAHSIFSVVDLAKLLTRSARTLNAILVAECNGDFKTKEAQNAAERKAERLRKKVTEACRRMGLDVLEFGEDCRGAAILLKVPSGATNDFCSRGIVVPE